MRLTAFFKIYKTCILLHRCNRKIFAKKNRFEKSAIFVKIQQIFEDVQSDVAKISKFQKIQLANLVDFEKMLQNAYSLA